MNVTIIAPDNIVIVDGRAHRMDLTGFTVLEAIHAVQWRGDAGEVEYTDGRHNALLETLEDFQPILDLYTAEIDTIDNPPPPTLEEVKLRHRATIDAWRETAERAGVTYEFPGGHVDVIQTRHADDFRNIQGRVTDAMLKKSQGITDPVIFFRAESDTTYNLTPDEAIDMGTAVSSFVDAQYVIAWQLKDQVELATTIEDVNAITWPST